MVRGKFSGYNHIHIAAFMKIFILIELYGITEKIDKKVCKKEESSVITAVSL